MLQWLVPAVPRPPSPALAVWFPFKSPAQGQPSDPHLPEGLGQRRRVILTLPVDLCVGLGLGQGLGQCPQPAGFVHQQQGQGWALGGQEHVGRGPSAACLGVPAGMWGIRDMDLPPAWLLGQAVDSHWPNSLQSCGMGHLCHSWPAWLHHAGAGRLGREWYLPGLGTGFLWRLRPREVKQHAPGHTANKQQSLKSHSCLHICVSVFSPLLAHPGPRCAECGTTVPTRAGPGRGSFHTGPRHLQNDLCGLEPRLAQKIQHLPSNPQASVSP